MAEQKTIRSILETRRKSYTSQIEKVIGNFYESVDLSRVEQFEHTMNEFLRKAEGKLEEAVQEQPKRTYERKIKKTPTPNSTEAPIDKNQASESDNRPRLTYYQYATARNKGKTNTDIAHSFRTDSRTQICRYSRLYKEGKAPEEEQRTEPKNNTRKNRLYFNSDNPEEMRKEAYQRLEEFEKQGVTVLNSKQFNHVLGFRGSERASVLSRSSEFSQYIIREPVNGQVRIYFKPEGLRKYIDAREIAPQGWRLIENYVPPQQNPNEGGDK